jgi:class 3 adenylate cyclase
MKFSRRSLVLLGSSSLNLTGLNGTTDIAAKPEPASARGSVSSPQQPLASLKRESVVNPTISVSALLPYVPRMLLTYLLNRVASGGEAAALTPLAPLNPPAVASASASTSSSSSASSTTVTSPTVSATASARPASPPPPSWSSIPSVTESKAQARPKSPDKKKAGGGVCVTYPNACLLIADVSGFTKLNETFAALSGGAEQVSFHLNQYFSLLLNTIDQFGGDCIKFAGDALICVFVEATSVAASASSSSSAAATALSSPVLRAVQCALALQANGVYETKSHVPLNAAANSGVPPPAVRLSLHIALAAGDIHAMFVGGEEEEYEFFVAGTPFAHLSAGIYSPSTRYISAH